LLAKFTGTHGNLFNEIKMAKTRISEYSQTAASNTDIDGININEGCAPSTINNAIRELMAQIKDFQVGAAGDGLTVSTLNATTATVTTVDATTVNATNLNIGAATFLSAVYPVGSIYINATNATNPGTLLGFGTWVAFGAGRVMVGFDSTDELFDTAEETGGSKDAIVVSHTHTATSTVTDPGHNHLLTNAYGDVNGAATEWRIRGQTSTFNTPNVTTDTKTTGVTVATSVASTGSSGTNANLQPYITVYCWKRTA
jgi:hypothetical protein